MTTNCNAGAARLISEHGQFWAMEPDAFHALARAISAGNYAPPKAAAPSVRRPKGIAVIPIQGAITMRDPSYGTTVTTFRRQLAEAMANPNVGTVVFAIDSPGGSVYGIQEAGGEIRAARRQKPSIAVVSPVAASAAYWLAAQASAIVAMPSGQVGSIGVWSAHVDMSKALDNEGYRVTLVSAGKYKVEGNPYEPLGNEAQTAMQKEVDGYYASFLTAVSQGRSDSIERVLDGYGQGRMLSSRDALAVGMVDYQGTLEEVLTAPDKFPPSTAIMARHRRIKAHLEFEASRPLRSDAIKPVRLADLLK